VRRIVSDLRYAVRGLRGTPGLTLVIIASLGLGLGATTTAYTWIDSFLLRPFPIVHRSDRLMSVYTRGPSGAEWSVSYPRYLQWRDALRSFDGFAVHDARQLSLRVDSAAPERVWAQLVSGNYFDVIRVRTRLGRALRREDEQSAAPVVVLSHAFWRRRFGADPGIVGRTVLLNSQGFEVVGIAPSGFGGTSLGLGFDLWLPVTLLPVVSPGSTALTQAGSQWLQGLARLADGTTFEQARAELVDVTGRISREAGDDPVMPAGLQRLREGGAGDFIGPMFYTLFGIAAVILLVACANVANLLLARAMSRAKEISVRLAIGAGRATIVGQLLTESLVLAILGSGLGVGLAFLGKDLFEAVLPPLPFPIALAPQINGRVVGFALILTGGTVLLCGLVPAFRATRVALVPALKDELLPGSGRSVLRSGLVIAQVTFACVALIAAGLFVRSARAARSADPGFEGMDQQLVFGTDLRLAGLRDSAAWAARDRLLAEIANVPGVVDASLTTDLPMSIGNRSSSSIEVEGYVAGRDENMSIEEAIIGPRYFETMGIPVVRGRSITERDRTGAPLVGFVNQAFAERFWPGQDPIGRRVRLGEAWRTVAGVVGNVKMESIGERPYAYIYYPNAQRYDPDFTVVVRVSVPPLGLVEPIRKVVTSVNPNLPLLDPRTMRENMAGAQFVQTAAAKLLSGLGLIALALAAVGLFAVLSYVVGQRTREIGIRLALGARTRMVAGLVAREAAGLLATGLLIGGLLGVGAGRLLADQLFGVRPYDLVTLGAIAGLLWLVGLLAALLPAGRAARVDPIVVLKSE
jgi:predicted permease